MWTLVTQCRRLLTLLIWVGVCTQWKVVYSTGKRELGGNLYTLWKYVYSMDVRISYGGLCTLWAYF